MTKLLFVTHDFTRTGAPILLLRLIKAIKLIRPDIQIHVACIYERMEIFSEYEPVIDSYIGSVKALSFFQKRKISKEDYKIILLNSIIGGEVVTDLAKLNSNCISWIHEMPLTIESYGLNLLSNIINNVIQLFVVDKSTQEFVQHYASQNHQKINCSLIRGCVDTFSYSPSLHEKVVDYSTIHVISAGMSVWRKGFYDIPKLLNSCKDIPLKLHWFGCEEQHSVVRQIRYELNFLGLNDRLVIGGIQKDFIKQIENATVFLAISHEEPGPLTILEAALMGLPSICWAKSIGLADFVQDGAGWVVEYQNYNALLEVFKEISLNSNELKIRGEKARKKVLAEFSSEIRAKQFLDLINLS